MGVGRRKLDLKTKIKIFGVIVVMIGFIAGFTFANPTKYDHATQNLYVPISIGIVIIGMIMILQKKFLTGLKNATKERCNCCKCINCDRSHNHWSHD